MEQVQEVELVYLVWFEVVDTVVGSDNMGNKEFSVGTLSLKEGTSLTKFPTVED